VPASVPDRLALRQLTAQLRSTSVFHCDTRMAHDQALELPEMPGTVTFHIVLDGSCTISTDQGHEEIAAGDLALLPHGRGHRVATGTGHVTTLERADRQSLGGIVERLDLGEGPTGAHLVCGALTLEHPAAPPLPATLDALLVVRPEAGADSGAADLLADLILHEALEAGPGWLEVSSRLVDVLALRAVRRVLQGAAEAPGWWSAVQDPRLVRSIQAVMDEPGTPWTLPGLAQHAAMSRTAYAELFRARVGETPMSWVARYRMRVARDRLAQGQSVARVARSVGYDSEVAFRRAFSRITGVPPGTVRRSDGPDGPGRPPQV
jgi:AraC-like DNA-binding protein